MSPFNLCNTLPATDQTLDRRGVELRTGLEASAMSKARKTPTISTADAELASIAVAPRQGVRC